MKITTKGRYAVTAMVDIAINASDIPVSIADIAQRHHISVSYLEQLLAKLRRQELVESSRGPGGGYVLGIKGLNITIAQIIDAVDETVDATACHGSSNCNNGGPCLTHDLWSDLSDQVRYFLSGITIGQLVQKDAAKITIKNNSIPVVLHEISKLNISVKQI
ncbi:MAG: Rrf2 family transcriptional regulator [Pseudomonadota bacterium]